MPIDVPKIATIMNDIIDLMYYNDFCQCHCEIMLCNRIVMVSKVRVRVRVNPNLCEETTMNL